MKKHKGFTLIELLAVILILGIIALIAIPTVTNIIKESKRGAFKSSVQNIISAVETECQLEQMRGEELTTSYSFTNGSVDNELNIKGDLPKSGTITVDSSCNVTVSLNNGDFCATKALDSESVLVGDVESGECVIDKDDNDNNEEDNGDSGNGGTANIPDPVSFAEDSWETIVANVKAGNLSAYNVGDTKEIILTGFTNTETDSNGLYTIRIANISNPAECSTAGYSQTACGFVIEFEDIIVKRAMNSTSTNVGGWEASEMRIYINDTIYNALPTELRDSIADTTVVSGHGSTSGETNFTTIDKVYLLSTQEVWGSNANHDAANAKARQLDYYAGKGVTSSNYSSAIKKYNGSVSQWWLHAAYSYNSSNFNNVNSDGSNRYNGATKTYGVAPAFRIN